MRNLITYEDISRLARPCTTDEDMAAAMIAEAQRVEVKPRLGDPLYLKLLNPDEGLIIDSRDVEGESTLVLDADDDAESTVSDIDPYKTLLNGGQWVDRCGERHWLTGLKTALAYYALARIVRDGNIQATTYGAVVKDDQHSADAERSERQRQYRELFAQADGYMAEVLTFITKNSQSFPEYKVQGAMRSNRMTIRTIGK